MVFAAVKVAPAVVLRIGALELAADEVLLREVLILAADFKQCNRARHGKFLLVDIFLIARRRKKYSPANNSPIKM